MFVYLCENAGRNGEGRLRPPAQGCMVTRTLLPTSPHLTSQRTLCNQLREKPRQPRTTGGPENPGGMGVERCGAECMEGTSRHSPAPSAESS